MAPDRGLTRGARLPGPVPSSRARLHPSTIRSLLTLPVVACGTAEEPATPGQESGAPAVALAEGEREVRCGCKIDSVGHCGNYVAEGGEWLEISNDEELGLGHMEWCGVPADQHPVALVAGQRTGGTVALTKLEMR